MILKLAFGGIAILATVAGIVAITGEPVVAAAFAFGSAVLSGISLAYLLGRDGKKSP
ncbi:hypothetical protein [Nesterenkonia natronophila]|uniref:hypothetical protein n=1 Tax=Nesterenkonia natronophila TaxID=2174932 RepID=UPI00131491FB|nr:hypothetical protein [Nesterenkonia natronophila]